MSYAVILSALLAVFLYSVIPAEILLDGGEETEAAAAYEETNGFVLDSGSGTALPEEEEFVPDLISTEKDFPAMTYETEEAASSSAEAASMAFETAEKTEEELAAAENGLLSDGAFTEELLVAGANVYLEGMNNGTDSIVFENSNIVLTLNTTELDNEGFKNYQIIWKLGRGWTDQDELVEEYTGDFYSVNGKKLTLYGDKMAEHPLIQRYGYVAVYAEFTIDGQFICRSQEACVWLEHSETRYDLPFSEDETFLPGWAKEIEQSFNYYVWNAEYPAGHDSLMTITNVKVENADSQKPAFRLETRYDENGRKNGWILRATENLGEATVTVSYTDENGKKKNHSTRLFVGGDVYWPWLRTQDSFEYLHKGESVRLFAGIEHYSYSAENGSSGPEMPEAVYEFEIPEESSWLLKITPSSSDLPDSVTVTAVSDGGSGNVLVHVFGKDEKGRKIEVATAEFWLSVYSDYTTLIPAWIDPGLRLGQTTEIKPHYVRSYIEDGKKVEENIKNIRFRWEYDPDAVVIEDKNGNTPTYDQNGAYIYTPGSYGDDAAFRLSRLTVYDTDLWLYVERENEDGSGWHDEWARTYHLNGIEYNAPIVEHQEGKSILVRENRTRTIHLDTSQLDADGFRYEISWQGGYWDDNDHFIEYPGLDCLTVSGDGKSVTVDGTKMAANERIRDACGMSILVRTYYNNGMELTAFGDFLEIGEPDKSASTVVYKLSDQGSGNLRIYWRSIGTGVDGYQIRWSADSTFKKGTKTASYSHTKGNRATRPNLTVGTTYYVGVRTYYILNGRKVYSNWSGTKQLTLQRTLTSPKLNSAVKKGSSSVIASWNKVAGVEGYQLRYSQDPDFKGIKTASVSGQKKTSFKRGSLSSGTWYVSVRAYKTASDGTRYYSAWSNVISVKI